MQLKKRGRPLTLGDIDREVQSYIKALRAAGTPISAPLIIAAAEGIVIARDRTLLAKNGGSIIIVAQELGHFHHAENGVRKEESYNTSKAASHSRQV